MNIETIKRNTNGHFEDARQYFIDTTIPVRLTITPNVETTGNMSTDIVYVSFTFNNFTFRGEISKQSFSNVAKISNTTMIADIERDLPISLDEIAQVLHLTDSDQWVESIP